MAKMIWEDGTHRVTIEDSDHMCMSDFMDYYIRPMILAIGFAESNLNDWIVEEATYLEEPSTNG